MCTCLWLLTNNQTTQPKKPYTQNSKPFFELYVHLLVVVVQQPTLFVFLANTREQTTQETLNPKL